ncbi:L,D-transpeptidase family protein, partial [Streptomyces sp. NPDC057654]|uniref:L,D-transpeptidase family protein n=1 Tax=Streptomyces sp. NPDC057654 TaxID=3346196 RepID=UPI00367B6169
PRGGAGGAGRGGGPPRWGGRPPAGGWPPPTATESWASQAAATPDEVATQTLPRELPGLGPRTLARIPAGARQAVVVTGEGKNSPKSTVVVYERTSEGWRAGASWPAHNALRGWSEKHRMGDLRSPIGVFTLTDAGGRLADPGAKLPYTRSRGFTVGGTGFADEPLAGSFDYVVAINYNRKPGTSPMDWTRPMGEDRGGGIWLHVDHGGPTHGCVSVGQDRMAELLRTLDPARKPIVVMGDAASLRR